MSSFTTTTVTAGVKCAYESPRIELTPLELLLSDVFIHVFKDFGFKDLLNVERVSRSFWNKAEGSWKLMAQKNGCFDLTSYPKEGCPERWQCLVRELLFLHIKNKKNTAVVAKTIKETHAAIFQLFPRLGALIWRDLDRDQNIFPWPVLVDDSARGGDFLLEGLYQLTGRCIRRHAYTCLTEAIQRKVSCVSYFAVHIRRSSSLEGLYALAKMECERGDLRGINHFFRKGFHREFKEWKKDLHLPFILEQLLFNSGLSWEEKEMRLGGLEEAYNQNFPSWLKARCAYIKFKLGKQEESDQLYKEALDNFKLTIPERKWMDILKTLYLDYLENFEDKREGIRFYEMAVKSYSIKAFVPALMWAGFANMTQLGGDLHKANALFNKAISVSNSKLPDDVWGAAISVKNTLNDWKGLEELCEKALTDLAAGDIAKAPNWLRWWLNHIEVCKKKVPVFRIW